MKRILLVKLPNKANCIKEIQEYLFGRDIFFDESYSKADFFKTLAAFNIDKEYVCDNIIIIIMKFDGAKKIFYLEHYTNMYRVFN